jgi:glycosyltransferase involved in cell wall biosynthesis
LTSNAQERLSMHNLYRLPVRLLSVSTTIQEILMGVYRRESQLFPNGIDTDFYYPLEEKHNDVPAILMVGNPSLTFKGFEFALKVLSALSETGQQFEVWWASQIDFTISRPLPFLSKKFIALPQEKLAELYRNSDIFLSTSLYESFPLPPMEAMASGVAVVSTDNGGINTYAKPGENCLLSEQGDLPSTLAALLYLLRHPEQRVRLGNAGRETALHYSFDKVTLILEECLYRIVEGAKK